MTEKRFYYAHRVVWDTKKPNGLNGISINDLDRGLRVANWLNELNEENNQLKQFQKQVANVIESKMGNNICNDYKIEILKEIWNELELDKVWFE